MFAGKARPYIYLSGAPPGSWPYPKTLDEAVKIARDKH